MAPVVIDLNRTDDPRDGIHRAVQRLAEGGVVTLPTETVYGLAASALHPDGVRRLIEVKGRSAGHPFTLAVRSADAVLDYCPAMSAAARRLARRVWPGPLTLVCDDDGRGVARHLPPPVREAVCHGGTVGLRVPNHPIVLEVLRLTAGPLILTSANRSGEAPATSALQAVEMLGDQAGLVLDAGPCRFGEPSTVVRVTGDAWEILRPGVLSESALRRLAAQVVLFVCTGNTCRSPMAEHLFRHGLATRLGVADDELDRHGWVVGSAGLSAYPGGQPTPEAVAALTPRGIDLSIHQSQPITEAMLRQADLVLTMTRAHRAAILSKFPDLTPTVKLLDPEGQDVADPFGNNPQVYRECAAEIERMVATWVEKLAPPEATVERN